MAHEVQLQVLMLERVWAQNFLGAFAEWLYQKSGSAPNLCKEFQSHVPMFQRLDAVYMKQEEITPESLLQDFGSKFLRKHLQVTQFLQSYGNIKIPGALRKDSSDLELITKTLRDNASYSWGEVLSSYVDWLEQQSISVRTRRMYLRTAVNLCEEENLSLSKPLTVESIARFTKNHPGSRANISKFVSFCTKQLSWELRESKDSSPITEINEFDLFRSRFEAAAISGGSAASYEDLTKILSDAFSVEESLLIKEPWAVEITPDTFIFRSSMYEFIVPEKLRAIAEHWAELRQLVR